MLVAEIVVPAYVIVSILFAIHMYFAYGAYAHIEYNPKKWRKFGTRTPRRLVFLLRLRRLAGLAVIAAAVAAIIPLIWSDSSSSSVNVSAQ
ncbi:MULTISPECIES: hypothetical protein [unclassified Caballeronia]|uniref:hypothetical protein n=1 Tax=unclassified Caballeronia TaxID=2646786 RepID=UPI0013E9BB03|nr:MULTISPECIES: hypothetical protein [unclassified Caballeronia]